MSPKQRFLFLQSVCSPFFQRLGKLLKEHGHVVRKVNFTFGDQVYWRQGGSVNFRGPMHTLPEFYSCQYHDHGITDIVLFGDCRPVHRPAIAVARQQGIRVHVFEEGYFRPYWITLERDGVNGNSRLPRDPEWYKEEAKKLPHFDNGTPFRAPFWNRAAYDIGYHFWMGLNPIFHHGVKSHAPNPVVEYLSYIRRGLRIKRYEATSRKLEAQLIAEAAANPYYLMPLQLASDSQITHHSPFRSMAEALRVAMVSFALHAPRHTRFAAKIHPLDPGLVDYRQLMAKWGTELEISDRIVYLESGNLPLLLTHTAGVITVNSTVGGSSLIHGRPTVALGTALYDMPSLTFQGGLDRFWVDGEGPDRHLVRSFRDVVIDRCQVNGGFYSNDGIRLAVTNSLPKLSARNRAP